jgi:hypothetical protein
LRSAVERDISLRGSSVISSWMRSPAVIARNGKGGADKPSSKRAIPLEMNRNSDYVLRARILEQQGTDALFSCW